MIFFQGSGSATLSLLSIKTAKQKDKMFFKICQKSRVNDCYGINRKGKGRRCCMLRGRNLFNFFDALSTFPQDDLKKNINRKNNNCLVEWTLDNHPVHTIPNRSPSKLDVLPKTFVQIILDAKLLVRHSCIIVHHPNSSDDFIFFSVFILLLWYGVAGRKIDQSWNLKWS